MSRNGYLWILTSEDSARTNHPLGKTGGSLPGSLLFLSRLIESSFPFFPFVLLWENPTSLTLRTWWKVSCSLVTFETHKCQAFDSFLPCS